MSQRLATGDTAPDFTLASDTEEQVSLSDLRGSAGIQLLKEGLLSTIREALPPEHRSTLKDVLLEEMMIQ